ncbi:putative OB-fold protein [Streptomyces sp. SAI-208]|uniref:zinc ribbon domain-containing protein n=1 Tax=unclassified Streptomyces TaxID=2593676 RepID=UPI0024762B12|nr:MULTISPECIES: zinc ribbon domain-containing protein [unclassified Streptomyces]MDH6514058.1 putative OB-fold protein [Streptomyces sp. SAI-090]MDH6565328.1 putative OB-fold protein [Streptomyces sp. SAI-117]MDH6604895.1 putative OB-fold protein [Streptomyces sp. SAI-208]MDH6621861.1 putative OB-fold protein [Streptomyces sp. SAI-135]
MSVTVQNCRTCGGQWFPARLLCPRCGGADLAPRSVERGVVEQLTHLGDVVIASVACDPEPLLVARLHGPVEVGDVVELTDRPEPSGRCVAFVPPSGIPREELS